jgi:hypothetical protein
MDYDYTIDDLTAARVDGWDDCKKLVIELLVKNNIDKNVIDEINSEEFGVISSLVQVVKK